MWKEWGGREKKKIRCALRDRARSFFFPGRNEMNEKRKGSSFSITIEKASPPNLTQLEKIQHGKTMPCFHRSTALGISLSLALVAAVAAGAGAISAPSPVAAATEALQLPKMTTEPQQQQGGKRGISPSPATSHSAAAAPGPTHEVLQLGRKSKGFG